MDGHPPQPVPCWAVGGPDPVLLLALPDFRWPRPCNHLKPVSQCGRATLSGEKRFGP